MNSLFDGKQNRKMVAAVGSALVDMCLLETDEFLLQSGAMKGGMTLTDKNSIEALLQRSSKKPSVVPGGSACNTILGVGKLGGKAKFIGKCGRDDLGSLFEAGLRKGNVEPVLFSSGSPTGHVLSIITPDAQRSMFTYLGASSETHPDEIQNAHFENAAVVHIEGYLLFNEALMMAALTKAKSSGAMISLDLASFTVVESARALLNEITNKYVDILIANEDEAKAFTGFTEEIKALETLAQKAKIAVLKVGKRGSYIAHGGQIFTINAVGDGKAIDTTGAGDLWASGFLYGLVHGYSIEKAGAIGSACGHEVCQVIGASIPDEGWSRIRAKL